MSVCCLHEGANKPFVGLCSCPCFFLALPVAFAPFISSDFLHQGQHTPPLTSIAVATRRFAPVRQWLLQKRAMPSNDTARNNNEFLVRVSDIIHRSQYKHLGKEAMEEKRDQAVRLPMSIFLDNSPWGGLCLMLHECIVYMQVRGFSADDS